MCTEDKTARSEGVTNWSKHVTKVHKDKKNYYMKKERKLKNENGAKKQQKTTFLMQMIYCDRRV